MVASGVCVRCVRLCSWNIFMVKTHKAKLQLLDAQVATSGMPKKQRPPYLAIEGLGSSAFDYF